METLYSGKDVDPLLVDHFAPSHDPDNAHQQQQDDEQQVSLSVTQCWKDSAYENHASNVQYSENCLQSVFPMVTEDLTGRPVPEL